MSKKKLPNFEDSLNKLEQLVDEMDHGDLSLEESLKAFEDGIKLTRECQKALQSAEQKVQILMAKQGTQVLEDFAEE